MSVSHLSSWTMVSPWEGIASPLPGGSGLLLWLIVLPILSSSIEMRPRDGDWSSEQIVLDSAGGAEAPPSTQSQVDSLPHNRAAPDHAGENVDSGESFVFQDVFEGGLWDIRGDT